jgi:glycosyltransferase involved in cell wall biosynthesis
MKSDKQITVIYPPTVDYYMLFQRPQQLLKALSKIQNVRSIFITSEVFKKLPKPIVEINKDMYVVSGNSDYASLVKGKVVFWVSYPDHIDYPLTVQKDVVVFDAIDNPVEEFSYWAKNLKRAIDKADLISCTANVLFEQHSKNENKPVFLCPNGGDYDHFKKAKKKLEKPSDFPVFENDKEVIGFYGALASWLDIELIQKIAEKFNVVLIGKNQYYPVEVVHPNIANIEHKDYSQLPYYLSHFDVAMIPFKLTEMMKGCDPVKLQEYLSSGKPVVATEIEDVVANFSDVVDFINIDNCHEVIEKAIKENSSEKEQARIQTAINNSWDVRAQTAIKTINEYMTTKGDE